MDKKQQQSKQATGTLTAQYDANGDYSSKQSSSQAKSPQASKAQFGTLTATQDANNDYSSSTATSKTSKSTQTR